MSESPYGLIWPRGTRPFGTLGAVRQHPALGVVNEARVVDEAGADLGPGETGELLLRNPVLTPGYWGMPEETAGRLAAFKVPRYWQQVDDLPRTPTSRVAKHQLPAGHPPGEYDAEAATPGAGR